MKNKTILTTLFLWVITLTVLADSGIYICGHFRRDRINTVPALKASGYTFGILFNVHVQPNGDLITDGETICKDGKYVFGNTSPNYVDDVNALLTGNTSILRLEHCIGGWGNDAYKNISNLVKKEGTGPNSILYKNFKALKDAIPAVIAINNDIEQDYDANTQALFHIMLYDIGFKTTIAPYMNKSYWDSFVKQILAARPGAVDRNYLQCYGGGAGNNPKDWKIEGIPVYGSRDIEANGYTHNQIVTTMTKWKNEAGIVGGFYWNYNTSRNLKAEAAPINAVFGGGDVAYRDQIVAMMYPVKDYKAPQTDFSMGAYSSDSISSKGFDPVKLASVKLKEGVKMILYTGIDNTGESFIITKDTPDISAVVGTSKINSWTVLANRIENISEKEFYIKNKQSGYYLMPSRNVKTNTSIQQKILDDTDFRVWKFEEVKDGLYKIVNKGSDLVLQVQSSGIYNEAYLEQSAYRGNENQHFIVIYNMDADSYKLIALHSLKYVGLRDASQNSANANVVQRTSSALANTNWILESETSRIKDIDAEKMFNVYPRVVTDEINIDCKQPYKYRLKITDLSGRILMEEKREVDHLNISFLNGGVYFLFIEMDNVSIPFKIIKK